MQAITSTTNNGSTDTTDSNDTPILQRRRPHYGHRRAAWYDVLLGELVPEAGPSYTITSYSGAGSLLEDLASQSDANRPRVVYVCGGDSADTTPPLDWWLSPLGYGWQMLRWHNTADSRTAQYERGGIIIELRMAAPWFGSEMHPRACRDAWRLLEVGLRGAFDANVTMMPTPAMVGTQLFEAALPFAARIAPLDAELRDTIRTISTQGRIEMVTSPDAPESLTAAYQIDGRWMYAACLSHLPLGRVQRDTLPSYAGFTPGFYRVNATVPRDWAHIGLLPMRSEAGHMVYPAHPGLSFTAWASSAEIAVALEHGWITPGDIRERILWPETHDRGQIDPAAEWLKRLKNLRSHYDHRGDPVSRLASGAVRHLALDTVGRWWAGARETHGLVPLSRIGDMPRGAVPHIEGGVVSYTLTEALHPRTLRHEHPEWAATVWGRARARLVKLALRLPRQALIALRTDGVWLSAGPEAYPWLAAEDRGQPGQWRVKSHIPGPVATPRTEAALLALMTQAQPWGGK